MLQEGMNKEMKVVNTVVKKASEITVDDIARSCAKYGVTLDSLCAKGVEFLGATKERYDIMENKTVVEPQYQVQLKAWFGFLELLKLVSKEGTVATVGAGVLTIAPEDVVRLESIAKELKGLESRLGGDGIQRGDVVDASITVGASTQT